MTCLLKSGAWYTPIYYYWDSSGDSIPVRYGRTDAQWQGGDTGANYNHASGDHNLCNLNVFHALFVENSRGPQVKPDRYQYEAITYYPNSYNLPGEIVAYVFATASFSHGGFGDVTRDGRPFGMVTAYCEYYTRCPSVVNESG